MIQVENLTKTFRVHEKEPGLKASVKALFHRRWKKIEALSDASFEVQPGEIVGLIGANGAGKTTLVKILAGIIHPTSGTANVLGHTPWRRENAFRRQIALIMGQKAQLWWDLPAGDCFLLLREIYEIPEKLFKARLDELTEKLNIRSKLNIQIRRLSLGERMKMELIATLLHQPKVVFLDEPTIGLDISAQRALRDFVLDYRRKYKPAMIVTSHYMQDIEHLCKRVLIIKAGRIIYDGSLDRIVKNYAQNKIITAHIQKQHSDQAFDPQHAKVLKQEAECIQVKALRDFIPETVSSIMQTYSVNDLSIEEEDISRVIEKIMQQGIR
ncbi:ATP-binding cassette domain-containing protein [Oligoflexia bacterium]|nr:ATP-binding cassette domain-containing protein [Oligoflexia bacterium]